MWSDPSQAQMITGVFMHCGEWLVLLWLLSVGWVIAPKLIHALSAHHLLSGACHSLCPDWDAKDVGAQALCVT